MPSIIGTENPDNLKGSDQADIIIGLGGADTISGGDGDDTLDGGDYSNLRYIDAGNVIDGGAGDDVIYGGSGRDILRGGAGDDIIVGQGGSDSIDGGDGFDFAVYSRHDRGIFADLSTGIVTIFQAVSGSTVHRLTSIEGIIGTAFSDFLTGDAGVNALYGAGGNDFLIGGAGSDLLDGGAGFDVALYTTMYDWPRPWTPIDQSSRRNSSMAFFPSIGKAPPHRFCVCSTLPSIAGQAKSSCRPQEARNAPSET